MSTAASPMTVVAASVSVPHRHHYPLKTPMQLHRRVKHVANAYGMSYNSAVCLLIKEALDARNVPEHD